MIYPSGDELERKVGSKFALVMAVSKRAKQLREGSPAQVDTRSTNPITIALEEIAAGKLNITVPTQEQVDEAERHEGVPKTPAREAADLLRLAADEELAVEGVEAIAESVPETVVEEPVQEPVAEAVAEVVEEAPAVEAKPKKTRKKAEPAAEEPVEAAEAPQIEAAEVAPVVEAKPKRARKKAEPEAKEPEVEAVEVAPAEEAKPKRTRKKAEPEAEAKEETAKAKK